MSPLEERVAQLQRHLEGCLYEYVEEGSGQRGSWLGHAIEPAGEEVTTWGPVLVVAPDGQRFRIQVDVTVFEDEA